MPKFLLKSVILVAERKRGKAAANLCNDASETTFVMRTDGQTNFHPVFIHFFPAVSGEKLNKNKRLRWKNREIGTERKTPTHIHTHTEREREREKEKGRERETYFVNMTVGEGDLAKYRFDLVVLKSRNFSL